MKTSPIAYMDSGIGGLTVVKVAFSELPNENLIYLGDEARLPYGRKTVQQVRDYSTEIGKFFVSKGAKMMVIACNTATASALDFLQKALPIPVIGVIEPGSKAAVAKSKNGKIGVIATEVTVASHSYKKAIQKFGSDDEVYELACSDFVTLVESGDYNTEKAQQIVNDGLKPLMDTGIDTLVLGCTHFPIIAKLIQKAMGNDVTLINPGFETVNTVKHELEENDEKADVKNPSQEFYTTKDVKHFDSVGSKWLNESVEARLITPKELEEF